LRVTNRAYPHFGQVAVAPSSGLVMRVLFPSSPLMAEEETRRLAQEPRQSGVQHPACCSCARLIACFSEAQQLRCYVKVRSTLPPCHSRRLESRQRWTPGGTTKETARTPACQGKENHLGIQEHRCSTSGNGEPKLKLRDPTLVPIVTQQPLRRQSNQSTKRCHHLPSGFVRLRNREHRAICTEILLLLCKC
jgi:hypothetical protein